MDGGKSLHSAAHRAVRDSAVDGRDRLLYAPAGDHLRARAGLNLEKSDRWGLKGQAIAGDVYRGHRCHSDFFVDRPKLCF